jgi:cytidine deaminase
VIIKANFPIIPRISYDKSRNILQMIKKVFFDRLIKCYTHLPNKHEITMNETIRIMIEKAKKALKNSYSPYSHFAVASCICTDNDLFFTGVNIENASYPLSICAEMSAISQMVNAGQTRIKSIVVLAGSNALCPPCGGCRQCIFEFSTPDTTVYLCNNKEVLHTSTINELLPLAFVFNPLSGSIHD